VEVEVERLMKRKEGEPSASILRIFTSRAVITARFDVAIGAKFKIEKGGPEWKLQIKDERNESETTRLR